MGTISDKLTYLNTTKTMLRDSLNKFGSNILTNDTFRSYDTKLNDIYDKLPKVTATGQGLTISNVQNGLLDDFKINGVDLEQDTTETITVSDWEQGTIDSNGTLSNSTTEVRTSNFIKVYPNILYNISRTIYNSFMKFRFYDNNKNYLGSQADINVTTDNSSNRMEANVSSMKLTINDNDVSYIKLVDSSNDLSTIYTITTNATPSPIYPQEIKVVEGRQVITDKGKNLFNFGIRSRNQNGITTNYNFSQAIINGTTTTANSIVGFATKISEYSISLGTYSAGSYVFKFEKVSGNLTYPSGASEIHIRNSNDTTIFKNIVNSETTNYTKSFTLEQETELFIQWFVNESNWTFTDYICRFMIISDTDSATDYEPYYEPVNYNIDLNLENIYLAKIPNTDYKNRIYKSNGNWYYEEKVKKVVLDETVDVSSVNTASSNTTRVGCYELLLNNLSRPGSNNVVCNYLKGDLIWEEDREGIYTNNADLVFRINKTTIGTTKEEVLNWLSTNNLVVWYPLKSTSVITTQITNTTLIDQLEAISVHTGTNIITISNSNNIIPEIEITRLKELEKLA